MTQPKWQGLALEQSGPPFTFTEVLTNPASLERAAPSSFANRSASIKVGTSFYTSSQEKPKANVSEISREELDAKLEATEARMDARFSGMSAKLDTALIEIRADRVRFTQLESDLREVKGDLKAFPDRIDAKLQSMTTSTDNQIRGLKSNIWFGVATTIAAVGATLAIAISSFDSGRETSKSISEATVRMEKIQTQLDAAAKAQASTAGTQSPAKQ